jgi:hypothetical protein
MGKYSRHLGAGEQVELDGEMFTFKPLGIEYSKHFMMIDKIFAGIKKEDAQKDPSLFMQRLDEETIKLLVEIVFETVKQSADKDDTEEDIKQFSGRYFMRLINPLLRLNHGGLKSLAHEETKKQEALGRLKKKRDDNTEQLTRNHYGHGWV